MAELKVSIIGGGPAGSSFALFLLHFAHLNNRAFDITIFHDRDFTSLGAKGCKGCAGLLSVGLTEGLKELGLTIPEEIIQSRIERYAVHSPYTSVSLSNPDKGAQIYSIYRGGGPRISGYENNISFDDWLLRQAEARGAKVDRRRVTGLKLDKTPVIEIGDEQINCGLAVLAAGINTGINSKKLLVNGVIRTPVQTQTMAQEELYVGQEMVERLGNTAHVFLLPNSGIIFGTLVPKGPYISVSLLSSGKRPASVTDFLNQDIVKRVLPDTYLRACGCRPRVLIAPNENYYGENFVAIGDSAVTRLYKDGIGSSLLAAREAARTVVYHGATAAHFKKYYVPQLSQTQKDNRWGKILLTLTNRAKDSRIMLLALRRLIGDEQSRTTGKRNFTRAAWGMFTGAYSYKYIARMVINPLSAIRMLSAMTREKIFSMFLRRPDYPHRLHVGSRKILILGSGFSGTYCLRHLVRSLNRNENIETTMISEENFFLFSPLLHEAAMGGVEITHIAYPIRRLHWRDRFNFVHDKVTGIDVKARRVTTQNGTYSYDYLILALGSVTDTSALGSNSENVFTLKTLGDAVRLRNHVIEVFERASVETNAEKRRALLTIAVCGGGYVGIQLITQIADLIRKNMIKLYDDIKPQDIRIVLIEAESRIVSGLNRKISSYIMKHMEKMGIEVKLNSRITQIREDQLEINKSEIIHAGTIAWVTGVVANPLLATLDTEKDKIGRVWVNDYMEIPGFPGVFAVGDCAHFEDPKTGEIAPPRAHIAVRQAKTVANNLLAEIRGRDKKPYIYDNSSQVISLGDTGAVFRFYKLRFYGLLARLVWIGAYSLLVTGLYNRVRILADWLLSAIFGRDTTFLKIIKDAEIARHSGNAGAKAKAEGQKTSSTML